MSGQVTQPVQEKSPTPSNVAAVPACKSVLIAPTAGKTYQGDTTWWKCTSNCNNLTFTTASFSVGVPTATYPKGLVSVTTDSHSIYNAGNQGTQTIQSGNTLNLYCAPGISQCAPGDVDVSYSYFQQCNQIIINGQTFDYQSTTEGF